MNHTWTNRSDKICILLMYLIFYATIIGFVVAGFAIAKDRYVEVDGELVDTWDVTYENVVDSDD